MDQRIRIGLIGDFSPQVRAHNAIPRALELASVDSTSIETFWIETSVLQDVNTNRLDGYDGLWCVPGSPYDSMQGALRAIRFARENQIPFLGTCGGFQHALLEYFRNVLGMEKADHAESNAGASLPIIAPLSCPLVGAQGTIRLLDPSKIRSIYGTNETREEYHCNFGLNPQYRSLLDGGPLSITGVDNHGEARVLELASHPFFIGTLFQPELSAFKGVVHPLIKAFVSAAVEAKKSRTLHSYSG